VQPLQFQEYVLPATPEKVSVTLAFSQTPLFDTLKVAVGCALTVTKVETIWLLQPGVFKVSITVFVPGVFQLTVCGPCALGADSPKQPSQLQLKVVTPAVIALVEVRPRVEPTQTGALPVVKLALCWFTVTKTVPTAAKQPGVLTVSKTVFVPVVLQLMVCGPLLVGAANPLQPSQDQL
jgi:hypothetical protein